MANRMSNTFSGALGPNTPPNVQVTVCVTASWTGHPAVAESNVIWAPSYAGAENVAVKAPLSDGPSFETLTWKTCFVPATASKPAVAAVGLTCSDVTWTPTSATRATGVEPADELPFVSA